VAQYLETSTTSMTPIEEFHDDLFRAANYEKEQCAKLDGYYTPTDRSCYYNGSQNSIPCRYRINRKCYPHVNSSYTASTCANIGGVFKTASTQGESGSFCYYKQFDCAYQYANGQCYRFVTPVNNTTECDSNYGGYYENEYCYHECPDTKYLINDQCYDTRSSQYTQSDCEDVEGVYDHDYCYCNRYSNQTTNQCYLYFSSTYNEGTCASIGGYYSQNRQGCYYDSFSCSYSYGGQCYDRYYDYWLTGQCDEANGYLSGSRCYVSYYYCPYVINRKCYFYTSESYDCRSCRLLAGFMYSDTCYYKSNNCSEPLYLASNHQCYENQTTVRTAADCSSVSGETFHDEDNDLCYFSSGECSSGHYANCQCYNHRSTVYTVASCRNFDGYYINGRCYYNSSYCRYYHSIKGQCYRRSSQWYSQPTCLNIGGYYVGGTCYYDSFNCSGFTADYYECYMNRSSTYSRATCTNIGGIYGYLSSGRRYYSTGRHLYSGRTYYCLYNTFSCTG